MVCFRRPFALWRALSSTTLIALPSLLLLMGAILTLVWRRPVRAWAAGALVVCMGAWVASLGAVRAVPGGLSLSIWRPETVFQDQIALVLDAPGWSIGFGLVGLLLTVLLSGSPGSDPGGRQRTAGLLAFGTIGLVSIQAGNLLTLALSWTMLDLAALAYTSGLPTRGAGLFGPWGLLGNLTGTLLAGGAILGLPAGSTGSDLADLAARPWPVVLILGGAAIRLAASLPMGTSVSEDREGATAFLLLTPQAACLAALGRIALPVPDGLLALLVIAGMLALVAGSVGWLAGGKPVSAPRLPYLGLGIAGIAALSAAAAPDGSSVAWSAGGVLILMAGCNSTLIRAGRRVRQVGLLLGALSIAGLPFTPGSLLASALVPDSMDVGKLVLGLLGVVGMALLASGFRNEMAGSLEAKRGAPEGFINARSVAALVLLMASLVGTYFFLGRQTGPVTVVGPAVSLTVFALVSLARSRWPKLDMLRLGRTTRWLDPSPLLRVGGGAAGWLLRATRSVADLLEGEAALLWIYVLVVALGVAATVGG